MQNPIYVTGHKNPDTDSIVSAIAYAALKRAQGTDCLACRLGAVSGETEYLLERFGFDDPHRLYTAKSSIHDIEVDVPATVAPDLTLKKALATMLALENRGLVVVDPELHLLGIVTLHDLSGMLISADEDLEELIRTITLDNLADTLEGDIVLRGASALSGKMHVFPSVKSKVAPGSIVMLRNEDDKLAYALEKGAAILVVVTSSPISDEIRREAAGRGASILTTELSPLSVSRLIFQAPTIEKVMIPADRIVSFGSDTTLEEAESVITKSRYRSYPVLNRAGEVVGAISRYHLLNARKKRFILVDHNEKKQSVDDLGAGEVLEILDHHRMGGFESQNVIQITTEPLGATATLVARKYFEAGVPLDPNMAGILLGAIVSDTMNFNSPTATDTDREVAARLSAIAGVTADELSEGMIAAGESILKKRHIEIVYDDFKEFSAGDCRFGISQAACRTKEEFETLRPGLSAYLADACKSGHYDLMVIMLTNPGGSGSYLISEGAKKSLVADGEFIPGLVSRKKQMLPEIIAKL